MKITLLTKTQTKERKTKKMKKIISIFCLIVLLATPAFAGKKGKAKKKPAGKKVVNTKKTTKANSSLEYIIRPQPIAFDVVSFHREGLKNYTFVDYKVAFNASIILKNGFNFVPLLRFGGTSFFGIEALFGYNYKIKPNMYLSGAGGLGFETNTRRKINNFALPLRINFDYFFDNHHGLNVEVGDALAWGNIGFINHFSLLIGYSYKL